jgi:23S rRNA-/tRNA-specific pseudouridylate synthase
LYVDDEVAVIAKPARMAVGNGYPGVLGVFDVASDFLDLGEAPDLFAVQKLHEQASGVVLYARTSVSKRALIEQFSAGKAQVTYLALVSGYVDGKNEGDIDVPLRYEKKLGRLVACYKRGSPALTHYRIERRIAGNTLLECCMKAERPDQLRVHLAAIDHPLSVDPAMGGGEAILLSAYKMGYRPSGRRAERPLIDRLTLHAASLEFVRPSDGKRMAISAPMPKDLTATLTQLGRLV